MLLLFLSITELLSLEFRDTAAVDGAAFNHSFPQKHSAQYTHARFTQIEQKAKIMGITA